MELTQETIKADIKGYKDRLSRAEAKLNELPRKSMGRKRIDRGIIPMLARVKNFMVPMKLYIEGWPLGLDRRCD